MSPNQLFINYLKFNIFQVQVLFFDMFQSAHQKIKLKKSILRKEKQPIFRNEFFEKIIVL